MKLQHAGLLAMGIGTGILIDMALSKLETLRAPRVKPPVIEIGLPTTNYMWEMTTEPPIQRNRWTTNGDAFWRTNATINGMRLETPRHWIQDHGETWTTNRAEDTAP